MQFSHIDQVKYTLLHNLSLPSTPQQQALAGVLIGLAAQAAPSSSLQSPFARTPPHSFEYTKEKNNIECMGAWRGHVENQKCRATR